MDISDNGTACLLHPALRISKTLRFINCFFELWYIPSMLIVVSSKNQYNWEIA